MEPHPVPVEGLHQALCRIIEEGELQGKEFRYVEATATSPRLYALVDWAMFLTEMELKPAGEAVRTAIASWKQSYNEVAGKNQLPLPANQEVAGKNLPPQLLKRKFRGQGARLIPVAPGELLIPILTKLNNKKPRVAALVNAVNDTATRYFGGDTSMSKEVQIIRQIQQQLPSDHPMRAFGQAVENGAVGNLQPPIDPNKVAWHGVRDDTKESNKAKNAAIKQMNPNAKRSDYMESAKANAKAVTGLTPKEFRDKFGLKKYIPVRTRYKEEQLTQTRFLELSETGLLTSGLEADRVKHKLDVVRDHIAAACKELGLHDQAMITGPPKLNEAESKELAKVRADKRKTIEAPEPHVAKKPTKKSKHQAPTTIQQFFYAKSVCNIHNA